MKIPLTLAALLCAAPASAVTFDFAAFSEAQKIANGRETPFTGLTVDGITVTATTNAANVWMDGAWSGTFGFYPASGLGACDVADCNGSALDGIQDGEQVTLTFSERVRLVGLDLFQSSPDFFAGTGPDHTPYFGGFTVNGIPYGPGLDQIGTSFTYSGAPGSDTYIGAAHVAPIPLPATALLLIGGLAGLAMVRRARG